MSSRAARPKERGECLLAGTNGESPSLGVPVEGNGEGDLASASVLVEPRRAVAPEEGAAPGALAAEEDAHDTGSAAGARAVEPPRRRKRAANAVAPAEGAGEGGLGIAGVFEVSDVAAALAFQGDDPAVEVVVIAALDVWMPRLHGGVRAVAESVTVWCGVFRVVSCGAGERGPGAGP